ncbi:MAG TPA: hypothetical protein VF230_19185 [Acidimicrobiales bacterium]
MGVVTASGASSEVTIASARPVQLIGTGDSNADRRDELFISTGNTSADEVGTLHQFATLVDCKLTLVRNAEGKPYEFRVGGNERMGAGFGCVDTDGNGSLTLVGTEYTSSDGQTFSWTRTEVMVAGGSARNAAVARGTYRAGVDDERIALLRSASCGEKRFTG